MRQFHAWPAGSEEGALILAGTARFLAAHTPTRRELSQVVRIATRGVGGGARGVRAILMGVGAPPSLVGLLPFIVRSRPGSPVLFSLKMGGPWGSSIGSGCW